MYHHQLSVKIGDQGSFGIHFGSSIFNNYSGTASSNSRNVLYKFSSEFVINQPAMKFLASLQVFCLLLIGKFLQHFDP